MRERPYASTAMAPSTATSMAARSAVPMRYFFSTRLNTLL